MRVDANAGDGDGFDAVAAAVEVGSEALDDQLFLGEAAELADGFGDVRSAEVGKVVSIHAREHHVIQTPVGDRFRDVFWLLEAEWR